MNKYICRIAGVVLLAMCVLLMYKMYPAIEQFGSREITIENPYLIKPDGQGNFFIIDQEHTRVMKVNAGQRVEFIIGNNQDITYAEDIVFDGRGNFYILDTGWDESGFSVERERILQFNAKGVYQKICYETGTADKKADKQRLTGLTWYKDRLVFLEKQVNSLAVYQCEPLSGNYEIIQILGYPNTFDAIRGGAVNPESGQIYALDKRGKILRGNSGRIECIYQADSGNDVNVVLPAVLHGLAVTEEDEIYVTDIVSGNVLRQKAAGQTVQNTVQNVLQNIPRNTTQDAPEVFINLSGISMISVQANRYGDNVLGIVQDENVMAVDERGTIFFCTGNFPKGKQILGREAVFGAAGFAALAAGIYLISVLGGLLARVSLSGIQKIGIFMMLAMIAVAGIVVFSLLRQFSVVLQNETIAKLGITCTNISNMLEADVVERVNGPEDFLNEDFRKLQQTMSQVVKRENEFSEELYVNILRYENDRAFAAAYLDNSIGSYFPLGEKDSEDIKKIYQTKSMQVTNKDIVVSGSYMYVRTPILSKYGKVAGVVEVGADTNTVENKMKQILFEMVVSVVLLIVLIMFLYGEIIAYLDLQAKYKKKSLPLHNIRAVTFIAYIAFNMSGAFLPIYIAEYVRPEWNLPDSILISLPMTINLAFVAISSLFCESLIRKIGFRKLVIISALICGTGDILTGMHRGYFLLVAGLLLNGWGVGLITNALSLIITSAGETETRNEGYGVLNAGSLAGVNFGMMIGAFIAEATGRKAVFWVSAAVWGILLGLFLWRGKEWNRQLRKHTAAKKSVVKGLRPKIFAFLCMVDIPYIMIGGFLFFYFPIYANEQNYSENIICLFFMLYSMGSVFFGNALSRYLYRKLQAASMYLSTLIGLAGLLLFVRADHLFALITAFLLLGFGNSFGRVSRQTCFTELREVKRYGKERAMGIFNFMDNIGEAAAPSLSAVLAGAGLLRGMTGFSAVSLVLVFIYICIKSINFKNVKKF